MATIIDALVVTLGLDPAKFKKGTAEAQKSMDKLRAEEKKANEEAREASRRAKKEKTDEAKAAEVAAKKKAEEAKKAVEDAKKQEQAAKKVGEKISDLRNEMLRTAAVFVGIGAIKGFIESVTKGDAAVGRMARTMNMSIGELSTWKQVAEQAGVSGDAVASDMDNLSQMLQRFSLTGEGGEAIKYFRALGISLVDMKTGKVRDQFDVLLDFADKIKGMDPAKAKALGAGMGFSADTVALALKGRSALMQAMQDAKKNALTPEDEAAANSRNEAWTKLTNTFARLARDLLNDFSPAIVKVLSYMTEHAPLAAAAIGALTLALGGLKLVKFGGFLAELGKMGGVLGAVARSGGLLTSILGRLGTLGAAGAAGYAVGSLVEEHTGIGSKTGGWLYDLFNKGPDMSGGYVPGTKSGLGKTGASATAPAPATAGVNAVAEAGATAGQPAGSKQDFLRNLERKFGLPAGLLDSMWAQESGRGKNLTSRADARGDFQFMPGTAKQYGVDVTSFESSAQGAAHMLADLLRQFNGDLPTALAAYNWGAGNVMKKGLNKAPLETLNYAPQIIGRMRTTQMASTSTSSSEMHVDQIVINTQATDAPGIARDIHAAMQEQGVAAQANTGLS